MGGEIRRRRRRPLAPPVTAFSVRPFPGRPSRAGPGPPPVADLAAGGGRCLPPASARHASSSSRPVAARRAVRCGPPPLRPAMGTVQIRPSRIGRHTRSSSSVGSGEIRRRSTSRGAAAAVAARPGVDSLPSSSTRRVSGGWRWLPSSSSLRPSSPFGVSIRGRPCAVRAPPTAATRVPSARLRLRSRRHRSIAAAARSPPRLCPRPSQLLPARPSATAAVRALSALSARAPRGCPLVAGTLACRCGHLPCCRPLLGPPSVRAAASSPPGHPSAPLAGASQAWVEQQLSALNLLEP